MGFFTVFSFPKEAYMTRPWNRVSFLLTLQNMAKAKKTSKKMTPMEKLTHGYEKLIEGKEANPNGKEKFEKALKKATKQRGSR